jgi:quercetin dioxygenase-like cupin family protein
MYPTGLEGGCMESGVLRAGEGQSVWVVGDRYTIKTSGEETGGAFALVEALVLPGGGPPPHIHHREDEAFYILEGELAFHVEGRDIIAGAGSWVTLARGGLHHFKNVSDRPARMLIAVTPAGLERFFLEVGRAVGDGDGETMPPTPEDIEKLLATAPRYGVEIRVPEPA